MSVSTHWLCGALTAHPSAASGTFSLFCGFDLPHLFDPDVLLDYFHTFLLCIIKKTLQGWHSINICWLLFSTLTDKKQKKKKYCAEAELDSILEIFPNSCLIPSHGFPCPFQFVSVKNKKTRNSSVSWRRENTRIPLSFSLIERSHTRLMQSFSDCNYCLYSKITVISLEATAEKKSETLLHLLHN